MGGVVVLEHAESSCAPKPVEACGPALIGAGVVDPLITERDVFEIDLRDDGGKLIEPAAGTAVEALGATAEADRSSPHWRRAHHASRADFRRGGRA